MRHFLRAGIFATALALSAGAFATTSVASTLDFTGAGAQGGGAYTEDGLSFDDIRIVNGNCDAASGKACGALNDNETSILTKVGGGTFSLSSFWYQLLGKGSRESNTLIVTTNLGAMLTFAANLVGHNDGGHVVDLTALSAFKNITSLTFSTNNGGNVRIDDLGIPAAVPLPAGGLLLIGGLGALAALRRRKQA